MKTSQPGPARRVRAVALCCCAGARCKPRLSGHAQRRAHDFRRKLVRSKTEALSLSSFFGGRSSFALAGLGLKKVSGSFPGGGCRHSAVLSAGALAALAGGRGGREPREPALLVRVGRARGVGDGCWRELEAALLCAAGKCAAGSARGRREPDAADAAVPKPAPLGSSRSGGLPASLEPEFCLGCCVSLWHCSSLQALFGTFFSSA